MVDVLLFICVVAVVIHRFLPDIAVRLVGWGNAVEGMVLLPFAIVLETACWTIFGNSPGKALVGIKVTGPTGETLAFASLVRRQFAIYWRGLGCGIPIVTFGTLWAAHRRATRGEPQSWDIGAGSHCCDVSTSLIRTSVVAVAYGAALVWLRMAAAGPSPEEVFEGYATRMSRTAPVRLDSVTTLDRAVALPGRTIQFEYIVDPVEPETHTSLSRGTRGILGQRLVREVCANDGLKQLRALGGTFRYIYKNRAGAPLGEIAISSSECSSPEKSLLDDLRQAAERGDAKAQYDLAKQLDSQDPDATKAFSWYLKSATAGNVSAMVEVARRYRNGTGTQASADNAKPWWEKAAQAGDAEAQYEHARTFGFVYRSGLIIFGQDSQDLSEGAREFVSWLRKAADQHYAKAQHELGMAYLLGSQHVERGTKQTLIEREPDKGLPLLLAAAGAKYWQSQWALAVLYQAGYGAIRPDRALSDRYWAELDAQSDPEVQYDVGVLYREYNKDYYRGNNKYRGRALNFEETNQVAAQWLEKAAAKEHAGALNGLGSMYSSGTGVPKDQARAVELWTRAADHGNCAAQASLGFAYLNGTGVVRNYAEAHKWLLRAAAENTAYRWSDVHRVRNALGVFYEYGYATPKDPVLAYAWYNIAAAGGYSKAKENLVRVERELTVVQLQEAQALSHGWSPGKQLVRPGVGAQDSAAVESTSAGYGSLELHSSGTGFFVTTDGVLLTNNHVVEGCAEIRVPVEKITAQLMVADRNNDLALLRANTKVKRAAEFPLSDELKQGEPSFVFGFPLDGFLPASGNFTPGIVSALAGPGNNSSLIQITAPVQPGNSGGPLLDKHGRVIGVIVGKADAIKIASATGDIPQNVNFAIGPRTMRAFLDGNRIEYRRTDPSFFSRDKDSVAIAEDARMVSVKVECWRRQ
jgi:TPR repeat protein